MNDGPDFLPPEDEAEPERLKKKWAAREFTDEEKIECPHCRQPIQQKSFSCLYCGGRVFEKSGLLGSLVHWIRTGKLVYVILLILLGFLALSLF